MLVFFTSYHLEIWVNVIVDITKVRFQRIASMLLFNHVAVCQQNWEIVISIFHMAKMEKRLTLAHKSEKVCHSDLVSGCKEPVPIASLRQNKMSRSESQNVALFNRLMDRCWITTYCITSAELELTVAPRSSQVRL